MAIVDVLIPGLPGPPGPPGPAGIGSAWYRGAGAPAGGLGTNGDYYLDTTSGNIYGPKAAGAWGAAVFNIAEGQEGPAGPQGPTGPAGADATYSNAAPQPLAATASSGTATSAARADHVHQFQPEWPGFALSDESTALTEGVRLTVPYWPYPFQFTALPLWMVNAVPTGSALQVDIRVGGVSIFSTLPTIDATEVSTATAAVPAVFSTAFVNASQTIAAGSMVEFRVTQKGATIAGAGLKVWLIGRRA